MGSRLRHSPESDTTDQDSQGALPACFHSKKRLAMFLTSSLLLLCDVSIMDNESRGDSRDLSWSGGRVHCAEVVISVLCRATVVGRHVGSIITGFRFDLLCLCLL